MSKTMTGVKLPPMEPGGPEWLKVMSASKVAAMLGLSPWESRFSLWQIMTREIEPQPDKDEFRRGHYLEPAIAQWFQDQRPEWAVKSCHSYAHPDHSWATASPDRFLYGKTPGGAPRRNPFGLLEVKTANNEWEWGAQGTDDVPPGYLAQVQWQLFVTGLPVAYVAVLSPYMEFRWYKVVADEGDQKYMVEEAQAFMASLKTGEIPPLDDHDATYQALRKMSPGVTDDIVNLDADVAAEYVAALTGYEQAKTAKTAATSRVAQAMGNARVARFADRNYANRQSRKGKDGSPGVAYVVAARGLVTKESAV